MSRTRTQSRDFQVAPQVVQLPVPVQLGQEVTNPDRDLKKVEAWFDLIGWRVFGLVCLGLMLAPSFLNFSTGIPAWILLALTGAGLGGRRLADVILMVFAAAGTAATRAQTSLNDGGTPRRRR